MGSAGGARLAMRLTVLGASAVRPNPGGACAGYLLELGAQRFLIDCGSGVLSRLLAYTTLNELTGVFISHMHPDHCSDLVFIRQELVHGVGPKRRDRLPVYIGPGGEEVLARLGQVFDDGLEFWSQSFDLVTYDPALPLVLGDMEVRFAPTVHYLPCWAMRFEHSGSVLVYGADSGPCDALTEVAGGADLLILEATLAQRTGHEDAWGHLAPAESGAIAAAAGAKRLALTHVFAELDPEHLRAVAAAACAVPVELAREGDVFVV